MTGGTISRAIKLLVGLSLAVPFLATAAAEPVLSGSADAVASFTAVADATLDASLPNTALGRRFTIDVDGSPQKRSLIRFDVGGLAGEVSEARLRLFNTDGSFSGGSIHPVSTSSWDESTVTWNSSPQTGSNSVGEFGAVSGGIYEADVTPLVSGNGTISLALRSDSGNGADYAAREGGPARAPQLVVTTSDSPSPSQPATFAPVADATVRADQPNANLGASPILETDGSPRRRAYLRFSVTGLVGSITDARLSLLARDPSGSGGVIQPVKGSSWSESGITWNTAPSLAAGPTAALGRVEVGSRYEVDVTSLVSDNGSVSLAIVSTSSNGADYGSREAGAAGPRLIVTTTDPAVPEDVVIAAAGNIACDPTDEDYNGGLGTQGGGCRHKETSDVLSAIAPDAVLPLGDNQYEGGKLADYEQVYGPTWGRFKNISFPTPGNHEYVVPGAADHFAYFGSQAPAEYYSFDLGSWHLISLNSEIPRDEGSPQATWLRRDLETTNRSCVLAYWHRARFSSGPQGNNASMEPLYRALDEGGAEILLVAHDHLYERFAPQDAAGNADADGLRQFVVGTGGKSRHPTKVIASNSEVRGSTFGVLRLTLERDAFRWRFVAIPTSSFSDSGSGTCR